MKTLLKLQKQRVDEHRLIVTRMEAKYQSILDKLNALRAKMIAEKAYVANNPADTPTWNDFLTNYIAEEKSIEKELDTAMQALELARAALREVFAEQKKYEIINEQRLDAERKERNKREQIIMNERGALGFHRKKRDEEIS